MVEQTEIEDKNNRAGKVWIRLGLFLSKPLWAFAMLALVVIFALMFVPLAGPFLVFLFIPAACFAYWLILMSVGLEGFAREGRVILEGETITISVAPDPIMSPYLRKVYQFNWAEVEGVEGVFDSPCRATLLTLKTGERFKDRLGSDWSALREEAQRRGLFDNSGRHVSFKDVVIV